MASNKPAFICSSCARALRASARPLTFSRSIAYNTLRHSDDLAYHNEKAQVPRWQRTPDAMKMPFRTRPPSGQPEWVVNHDPEVLDKALDEFVGNAAAMPGRDILPEEVKWLTITHKSFEQGARGFNDRLAFLGKRIVEVQVSKTLVAQSPSPLPPMTEIIGDTLDLGPKETHPQLKTVVNITNYAKDVVLHPAALARLAAASGLDKAVRWQPRQVEALKLSGQDGVMAMAVFAVIGAIAMQRGGQMANEVARQRILKPLGLNVQ